MEKYMADNLITEENNEGSAAAAEETFEESPAEEVYGEESTEDAEGSDEETEDGNTEEETPAEADNIGNDDISRTKAFSNRLNAMSDRKLNEFIKSMGWRNEYTGAPITTEAEYKEFMQMHEAAQAGRDPVAVAEIGRLRNEVSIFRTSRQDSEMLNDPVFGDLYRQYRPDVINLMENARAEGIDVDVKGAFNAVLMQGGNFSKVLEKVRQDAEKNAIKKINGNSVSAVGSLGANAENKPMDFASMSSEEFEKIVKGVKNGQKINL